mmetsp:Transcript_18613/g.44963  ORF Transcript_18613/g.44963 Transcript_18613/m.44963 type:complete len:283 (-) Transcript_18613:138-986(-)|eukprot:CAMPEP_0113447300 /NCGR_PEP_ID=MMETSP0014_2-20120614/4163_1 /TAXON_ID=2857 /ORGANISM="Nitzschia sp." /LENGTH=282 /DNA_ID=CAMNT_0000338443 /DNA_START=486 /DNA_END=1334 /DNA_ORIENTATION=+ /assembly_acc=CAM_ASM_000159
MSVGTSYEQEVKERAFIGASELSPYKLNLSLFLPTNCLTKTHCVGSCEGCNPALIDSNEFERECLSITKHSKTNTAVVEHHHYGTLPKKVIHLFRSPFDNLVARMHWGVKRRRDNLGWPERDLANFSFDPKGFEVWCDYLDGIFQGNSLNQLLLDRGVPRQVVDELPCLSEWFRYISWHNNAVEFLVRRNVSTMTLLYEEYSDNYEKVVDKIFDFIELDRIMSPLPFVTGKTYESYYNEKQSRLAAELAETLASSDCWRIIRHYFGVISKEPDITSAAARIQ